MRRIRAERGRPLENALGKWVPDPIGICIFHRFAHPVGPWVDRLADEWVGVKNERMVRLFDIRAIGQSVPGQLPELVVEAVQYLNTLDPYLLNHFLVEVVQELLPRIALSDGDLLLQLVLQLVELELDLLGCPAFLVYARD